MSFLIKWAQVTSCHGILDFYESKNLIRRLFWGAIIAAAFAAIFYYQYKLIDYYLTIPSAVEMSKKFNETLVFPIITVCDQNVFSMKNYLSIYQTYTDKNPTIFPSNTSTRFLGYIAAGGLFFSQNLFSNYPSYPYFNDSVSINAEEQKFQIMFNESFYSPGFPKYNIIDFLTKIGITCDGIFQWGQTDCVFALQPFVCCNASKQISTDLGNCFEMTPINNDRSYTEPTQLQPGVNSGLQLKLRYNSSDAPVFEMPTIREEGFQISIGNIIRMTLFSVNWCGNHSFQKNPGF